MSILNPLPSSATGWLLRCILVRCLYLPSSCQHLRLSTRRRLTSRRQLHLLYASRFPRLVVALPRVAPLLHIHQLALSSAFASCCILFSFAPASCHVVSHQPATLRPPPYIPSPADGWLLHLLPAPLSATRFCLLPYCHALCGR